MKGNLRLAAVIVGIIVWRTTLICNQGGLSGSLSGRKNLEREGWFDSHEGMQWGQALIKGLGDLESTRLGPRATFGELLTIEATVNSAL